MIKTKLSKNGMITLPAKIRKDLDIQPGDEIGFIERKGEYHIIPILKMSDLVNSDDLNATKELIDEMRRDREREI